jgi:hypothetical protein
MAAASVTTSAAAPARPVYAVSDSTPLPDVPGITRAPVQPAVSEPVGQIPPPLFSNEGIVRKSSAHQGLKARIVGPLAGLGAALLSAGSALGHSVGGRASSTTPGTGAAQGTPVPSPYAPPVAPSPGLAPQAVAGPVAPQTAAPLRWLASIGRGFKTVGVILGTAITVVFLPIILGLRRLVLAPAHLISRRLPAPSAPGGTPDFDADGNPRRRRRVSPLWLAFGGFYGFLALIILSVLVATAMVGAPSNTPATKLPIKTPVVVAYASASSWSVIGNVTPKPSPTIVVTPPPIAKPAMATPPPPPAPTPVKTPAPTVKTTPTPVPTVTPVPTPFTIITTATPPKTHGSDASISVWSYPGWTCYLTRTTPYKKSTTLATNAQGSATFLWGGTHGTTPAWTAGTYTITAYCAATARGTYLASAPVTIKMP